MRESYGHERCHNCASCRFVVEGKEFVNPSNKRKYRMRWLTSCLSKFCIYAMSCECQLINVSSTSRSVKVTISEHVAQINNCVMEASVTSHFITKRHEPNSLSILF